MNLEEDIYEEYKKYIKRRRLIPFRLYARIYNHLEFINAKYWCFGNEFYDYIEDSMVNMWDEYIEDEENHNMKKNYSKKVFFK